MSDRPSEAQLHELLRRRDLAVHAAGVVRGALPSVEVLFAPSDHLAAKSAQRLEQSAQLLDRIAHNAGVELRRAYRYHFRSLPPDVVERIEASVQLEGSW